MSGTHYPYTIDRLERDENGHWVATLTIYNTKVEADRSQGSWRITPMAGGPWRPLAHRYAVALQERVRRLERAEQRAAS